MLNPKDRADWWINAGTWRDGPDALRQSMQELVREIVRDVLSAAVAVQVQRPACWQEWGEAERQAYMRGQAELRIAVAQVGRET